MQIESALHNRQEKAVTNFKDKLPSPLEKTLGDSK